MGQLIGPKNLRDILKISHVTLQSLEKRGLPVTQIGKSKRYNIEEVNGWFDQQCEFKNLRIGKIYSNQEISRVFKCSTQGDMRRSHIKNLLLYSDHTKGINEDKWIINNKGVEIFFN